MREVRQTILAEDDDCRARHEARALSEVRESARGPAVPRFFRADLEEELKRSRHRVVREDCSALAPEEEPADRDPQRCHTVLAVNAARVAGVEKQDSEA